jgi:hypothetical protein
MASIRVQKIFDSLQENLRRMGFVTLNKDGTDAAVVWQGRDLTTPPHDAIVIDCTSIAAWATGNLRAILYAVPAGDGYPAAAFTQSNASGEIIQGGVSFQLWMETPASFTGQHVFFMNQMLHILRGQMGAPVALYLSANGTQPTITGVNGAVASVGAFVASYEPWGIAPVGGI